MTSTLKLSCIGELETVESEDNNGYCAPKSRIENVLNSRHRSLRISRRSQRSYSVETAIVTNVSKPSMPKNHSFRSPILEALVESFWSWRSGKRSRYVGILFKPRLELLSLMYCLRYSASHVAWSDACHNVLLQGNDSSPNPPYCGRPGSCSMLNMWIMIAITIAVLFIQANIC